MGAILSTQVFADITPFHASYQLDIDGKTGTATRLLSQNGDEFEYKVSAKAGGIATANQTVNFRLIDQKIVPILASTSYKIAGIGLTHKIQYNGNKITSSYKGKTTHLNSDVQAYDDLSLEMQIRQELLAGKFSGTYPLVKKTSIEPTKFTKSATVKVQTPIGVYDAIKVDRVHDDKMRKTSFYLAPSLNYLPVKVSQTSDGKTISMTLSKIH